MWLCFQWVFRLSDPQPEFDFFRFGATMQPYVAPAESRFAETFGSGDAKIPGWASGNKPHPPREVESLGISPPVFICGRHAGRRVLSLAFERLDENIGFARRAWDAERPSDGARKFDGALDRDAVPLRDVHRLHPRASAQRRADDFSFIFERRPAACLLRRFARGPHEDRFRAADGGTVEQYAQMTGEGEGRKQKQIPRRPPAIRLAGGLCPF